MGIAGGRMAVVASEVMFLWLCLSGSLERAGRGGKLKAAVSFLGINF